MSQPKRIQRSRAKGWRMPEGAIYVGRPTKWGNPWKVAPRTVVIQGVQVTYDDHDGPVAAFRHYVTHDGASIAEAARTELRGHDLACWCDLDQPCHADVLLELANR